MIKHAHITSFTSTGLLEQRLGRKGKEEKDDSRNTETNKHRVIQIIIR